MFNFSSYFFKLGKVRLTYKISTLYDVFLWYKYLFFQDRVNKQIRNRFIALILVFVTSTGLVFLILVHSSREVPANPVLGFCFPKHRGRCGDLHFNAGHCSSQGNLSRASVAEEKSAMQTPDSLAAPLDSH